MLITGVFGTTVLSCYRNW